MCKDRSNHHQHSHSHPHHHGVSHDHHDNTSQLGSASLSRKDRLIMRLEHDLRHNNDHAASYGKLAEEAEQLGGEGPARLIRAAAEYTARQNEQLEGALALLRSQQAV